MERKRERMCVRLNRSECVSERSRGKEEEEEEKTEWEEGMEEKRMEQWESWHVHERRRECMCVTG